MVEVDEGLVGTGAAYTHRHALRGVDGVHRAAASPIADADVVAASGDRDLLRAWAHIGLSTYDTNHRPT
ncbi:twitching motility protein PilT [Georgenia yuyongxinii]